MSEHDLSPAEMSAAARRLLYPRQLGYGNTAGAVACALLSASGRLYYGVCIDVSSGIGFCAEHSAMAAMITAGETAIARIVAVAEDGRVLPLSRQKTPSTSSPMGWHSRCFLGVLGRHAPR